MLHASLLANTGLDGQKALNGERLSAISLDLL
jgi:hypothetical protein